MRWSFIRKVYGILSAQLMFTAVVVAIMILNAPVRGFVMTSQPFIWVSLLLPFISEWSLQLFHVIFCPAPFDQFGTFFLLTKYMPCATCCCDPPEVHASQRQSQVQRVCLGGHCSRPWHLGCISGVLVSDQLSSKHTCAATISKQTRSCCRNVRVQL